MSIFKKNAAYTASDIANYFLAIADENQELLSNLKLQKLVYYAQGIHLAYHGKPIFDDSIRAWTYGPVVPSLYHKYKNYGASGIPRDVEFDPNIIDEETREFLDEIFDVFGQFSAPRLMELTHTDECWIDAQPDGEISQKAIKESMMKYLKDEQE